MLKKQTFGESDNESEIFQRLLCCDDFGHVAHWRDCTFLISVDKDSRPQ